jgi:hypothetical protein
MGRIRWLSIALLFAFASCDGLSLGPDCNDAGEHDLVRAIVDLPLEEGTYVVEVVADGERLDCSFTYSGIESNPGCGFLNSSLMLHSRDNVIREIDLYAAPEHLTMELRLDGNLIAGGEFTPAYDRWEVNGRGCGFVERVTIQLPRSQAL